MGANNGRTEIMNLPLRSKKHLNTATLECLDLDNLLTERDAEEYARNEHDFNLPVRRLQQSRVGRCAGPKYLVIDGWHVRYTRQFIDDYISKRQPRVVDPADRPAAVL